MRPRHRRQRRLGRRLCRALALNGVNIVVNYAQSDAKAQSVADEMSALGVRAIAVRADTLQAICAYLHCQPRDLLAYVPDSASSR